MGRELQRAIRAVRGKSRKKRAPVAGNGESFRATVDLRLGNLERQLDELRGRINGLLFLLAGAVATQVILRLFA